MCHIHNSYELPEPEYPCRAGHPHSAARAKRMHRNALVGVPTGGVVGMGGFVCEKIFFVFGQVSFVCAEAFFVCE